MCLLISANIVLLSIVFIPFNLFAYLITSFWFIRWFELWLGFFTTIFLQNFDDVLFPEDHVSRSYNDTYYIDPQTVLRCHTSAHQAELLRSEYTHFLVTGDVYRRDSIDSTHYPVFHQVCPLMQ